MSGLKTLKDFVHDVTVLAGTNPDEAAMLAAARPLLADLLAKDDWLPQAYATSSEDRYCQYLLHCDPLERFSLVSFVWGPGQETPVHDHTMWGLLGVLRGSESSQRYEMIDGVLHPTGGIEVLEEGAIDAVSPSIGDIHSVRNGSSSRPSVSLHLYGGNIGLANRHSYQNGDVRDFKSGYSSATLPNIWSI